MKLYGADINILKFEIEEVSYSFKKKKVSILPEDVDFSFNVRKRRNIEQYKISYTLTVEQEENIFFETRGYAIFEFKTKMSKAQKEKYIYGNIIPSVYMTLRGAVFMLTYNSPIRILLPVVNFYKSYSQAKKE